MTFPRQFRLSAFAVALLPGLTFAQAPYERMLAEQQMVRRYLEQEAVRITERAKTEVASKERWKPLKDQRRAEMLDMLGLNPLPPRTPLNVQVSGKIDRGDYLIEKVAFESMSRVYATANLYLPKKRDGPLPAVIYVCGHAMGPHGNKAEYQRHGITLAKHGYAAFIIDSIQIAETFALHHGILNNEMEWWYSRGYTPAGLEVWNVIRALDYLETRPEIDAERFGITGRSGGAAMSWFSGSVDKRLKVVVPVMGNSTYAANVAANTQRQHCDCMFTVNAKLHGMIHQGALIAPRPLYMMHGREDSLFPVPGYEAFEAAMAGLYGSYGEPQKFRNTVVEGGHKDSDFLRAEAVQWFDRWLKKVPARVIDTTVDELPSSELAVFGDEPPANARNYRVHEFFGPNAELPPIGTAQALRNRLAIVADHLRDDVFKALPAQTVPADPRPGAVPSPVGFESLSIQTEPGIRVQAMLRNKPDAEGPAVVYIAGDGEDWVSIRDTLRQVDSDFPLLVVWPRGIGEVPWSKKIRKDMLRNAMHVGRTTDSMRVWDVMRASAYLRSQVGDQSLAVLGGGASAALGLYAAALDEQIDHVIVIDPPTTHYDQTVLLNVLRYTDLPEVAALIAPRKLTFYGRVPAAYEYTRKAFQALGDGSNFQLSMGIEASLRGRGTIRFPSGI